MIIDIHGHITSPALFKRFPMPPALADIDGMIEQKLKLGIGLTIVGSPVGEGTMMPVPGLDNYAQPPEQLKAFHDWLAETVAKHPGRLKAYCYTNPFGGDKLLQQTEKTVKEGGFVGLIINTSVKGKYLDDPGADDFFAMAAELDVPIFLHPPAEPVGAGSLSDFRLVEQVGRYCDVTVSLATLAFGGRMEKYPNLQFIGATAGGAIALLPGRLDLAYQPRHYGGPGAPPGGPPGAGRAGGPPLGRPAIGPYENKITQPPSTYIKRIWVDTATSSVPALLANLNVMGADHMLFGTDSPPLTTPLQDAINLVNNLPLSAEDKEKIFSGNARRLFKLGAVAAA
ncbi:MAG TPA: amidohydrolase family protein [Gemmataceae bacterium]|nr:amidohydrolase family protein [Gemmataceae bacterium]